MRRFALNTVLASLIDSDRALIAADLEQIDLPARVILGRAQSTLEFVYFLDSGVASTTTRVLGQPQVEIAVTGREGVVNIPVLLGTRHTPNDTYMQIAGAGLRISASKLREAMARSGTLSTQLLLSVHVINVQMSSTVIANARGTISERLARWLLMSADRTQLKHIPLTHEFLAIMLGVRRPSVTAALNKLAQSGLIAMFRGSVSVTHRAGLVVAANGYYGVAEDEFDRLFPKSGFGQQAYTAFT